MKRLTSLFILMIILLGIFILNGCGSNANQINITGSTSVQPIAEVLAEKFMRDNKDISINVQGGGSSAGIKAVLDGTADIGASSRTLTTEEMSSGLKVTQIALDGIAIVTNPQNKVKQLTLDQVRQIFSGAITSWSEVGGEKQAIMVVNREEGSGTRGAFTELVMGKDTLTANSIVQGSTGAVRQSVSGNPNAIGYISLASLDPSVKSLDINGVSCTATNIKEQKYPIVRPFLFLTKEKETDAVKKFTDYILNEGQKIIVNNGLISIK